MKAEKIAAVVVTFNRIRLLKKCIDALRKQIQKVDVIIIVDNSSSDGTETWLNTQTDIVVIRQANSGSAGGQSSGIQKALDLGADRIWCMDDDCYATDNALSELMGHADKLVVLNSVVLSNRSPNKLSFGLYDFSTGESFNEYSSLNVEVIESANFFNGTLFPKGIIETVGLPNKLLFIRGDEFEYYARIRHFGIQIITVVKSIVYHPEEEVINIGAKHFHYRYVCMSPFKRYYSIRNLLYIYYNYNIISFRFLIKNIAGDLFFSCFYNKNKLITLYYILKGIVNGILLIINNPAGSSCEKNTYTQ
ncbi:MAG: glycosyltransferase [Ignavibacteria bacterium]